ncbi:hypothetical protein [Pseudarthrobacter sp. NPDC080039]|uniref:hypothetical protein n=1 Tax=unclassified Pseudarthrobacter TaxID=2647000 RepID=UPI00344F3673
MKPDRHPSSRKDPPAPPKPAAASAGSGRIRPPVPVILRLLTVAALAVDALIHARLAPGYQSAAPDGIGEGNLFYIEAAAAAAAAIYVLVRPGKGAYLAALIIAAGGLGALLLYRYIDVPAFGPFPSMYEPVWFTEKALTALAQAIATITAATTLRRAPARPLNQGDQQ